MGWLWGRRQKRAAAAPPARAIRALPTPEDGSLPPLSYRNNTAAPVRILLEPWATEYAILPGQEVEIVVTGDEAERPLLFEQHPDYLVIWIQRGNLDIELRSGGRVLAVLGRMGQALPTASVGAGPRPRDSGPSARS